MLVLNVNFCTGTSMITANMSCAFSSSSASLTQTAGDTLTQHSQTVEVVEPANATKPITTTTPVQIKSTDESLHTAGVPAPTSVGLVQTASAPVVVVKQPNQPNLILASPRIRNIKNISRVWLNAMDGLPEWKKLKIC